MCRPRPLGLMGAVRLFLAVAVMVVAAGPLGSAGPTLVNTTTLSHTYSSHNQVTGTLPSRARARHTRNILGHARVLVQGLQRTWIASGCLFP